MVGQAVPPARQFSHSFPGSGCLLLDSMKKESAPNHRDEMREEYDLSELEGGVRGKYYRRATAGTNLVLIEPDPVNVFPDSNRGES